MATPVLVFESHSGFGRGIEIDMAGEPKGTTVRARGRAVGWLPENVTLNGPHCRMLEKRMVVKATTEWRKKRMGMKKSIGCEGAKEKGRNKDASDPAAQNEKRKENKVGTYQTNPPAARPVTQSDRDRC
jgi:hypothetical protein